MQYRFILLFLITEIIFIKNCEAQSTKEYIEYLKLNSLSIEDTPGNSWDAVLDSSFYRNNFFWIGESHGIKYSYDVLWILFEQIHKKTGFKYFMIEHGYISEIYLREYMETGEDKYLIMHLNSMKGYTACNTSAFKFYRKLFLYNQKLSKENKIELISIDIENQYKETDKYIRSLLRKSNISGDSSNFINIFLRSEKDYKNLYRQLALDIKLDSLKYKMILDSDYTKFYYMVKNINSLFIARSSESWYKTRDSLMFENYKTRLVNKDFISSKTFAYFGRNHCYLKKTNGIPRIASLINNSNPEIKSTSILFLYSECKAMRPGRHLSEKAQKNSKVNNDYVDIPYNDDMKKIYRKSVKGNFSIINIKNTNVSFWSARYLKSFIDKDSQLRDYFDYFLLIKNSPATKPYNE